MKKLALISTLLVLLSSCEYYTLSVKPVDPPVSPPTVPTLYEDFEGGLDLVKWAYSWNSTTTFPPQPGLISVASGKLKLEYQSGASAWECPAIHSTRAFDLRDRFVMYEIASATPGWMPEAGIIVDDDHLLNTEFTGGMIRVYNRDDGNDTYSGAIAFDPTAKFIRIRHQTSDDTYYIDFSSDQLTWTPIHSVAAYAGMEPNAVEFIMGACQGVSGPSNEEAQYSAVYTNAL